MEHLTGFTQSGADVELYVDQEAGNCYVSIESPDLGYLQFHFNSDFPQDAKAFFIAACEIRSIVQEG